MAQKVVAQHKGKLVDQSKLPKPMKTSSAESCQSFKEGPISRWWNK